MIDQTKPPERRTPSTPDRAALERELASIGRALQSEPDPAAALDRLLTDARRLTGAEAGTLFMRDQDVLRFVIVQNDFLERRVGNMEMRRSLQTLPLPITQNSLAGYVAITGEILNIPDVDRIPPDRPYIYNSAVDIRNDYKTHSVLSVPIRDHARNTLGVLQLINPLGPRREAVIFTSDHEYLATWFAEQAALFIPEHQRRLSHIILPSKGTSAPPRPPMDRAAAEQEGGAIQYDLAQLGFDPAGLEQFLKSIHSPSGVVLVAGPTGSGKTTTLYAALTTLNRQDVSILALEDPVESVLEGVNQVHMSQESGSFAGALRSLLKHDPDVMLVGEMRDFETAQTAVRAGMKGHLILSTLRTSDGASTIHRMLEMGVPPFVLAPALRIVVAQRLIRRVCTDCRETSEADEGTLVAYGHTPIGLGRCTFAKGKGCRACNFTGMRGRVGIFEVMPILEPIQQLILRSAAPAEIRDAARRQGVKTLREAGLLKVLQGVSTLEEVVRQTSTS